MKVLIYDGSHAGDAMAAHVEQALRAHLQSRGSETETIVLREQRIGNCAGDFFCWVRSPGLCNTDDDNRVIAAKMVHSDLLVYLTPVTFGGYSSALKRMVDHQIQNISPLFATVDGEIHHQKRYPAYPDLLVVGWLDQPDPDSESILRQLAHRNAINLHARTSVCGVITRDVSDTDLAVQASAWLEAIQHSHSSPAMSLTAISAKPRVAEPVHRALLLVGSPRTRKSTSGSLGGYLMQQLAGRGLETETLQIYTAFSSPARTRAALATVNAADLVVLAFPLYVDALPAPVVAALEAIALSRLGSAPHARFAAIANCGFPEAAHNATALAICAEFARESGFDWLGGLALGGGEGLVHGAPLDDLGGRAAGIRRSLGLAAAELAVGRPIPPTARDLLARGVIPAWLYRLMGSYGWRQQARQYGMERNLRRQPYLALETEK